MHKHIAWIGAVIIIIALVVVLALRGDKNASPTVTVEPSAIVTMTKEGFSPAEVSLKLGQAIKFVNATPDGNFWPASDLHPTHELYPEFDPRMPVAPGESWTFVFERTGNWMYHDHLFARKKGMVHVTAE